MQTNIESRAAEYSLTATLCACCSLPLVDALSVERGIGPVCWKRHGAANPEGEPIWEELAVALDALESRSASSLHPYVLVAREAANRENQRDCANALVRLIAIEQCGKDVLVYTNALDSLGYTKLASKIAKRLARVIITIGEADKRYQSGGGSFGPSYSTMKIESFLVKSPYEGSEGLRNVPGRQWDKTRKVNTFPLTSKCALFEALRRAYPGMNAVGPKGLFVL